MIKLADDFFLRARRQAGAQVSVAEFEPPAVAEIAPLICRKRVIAAADGDRNAVYRDGQIHERKAEIAYLAFARHRHGRLDDGGETLDVPRGQSQHVLVIAERGRIEL